MYFLFSIWLLSGFISAQYWGFHHDFYDDVFLNLIHYYLNWDISFVLKWRSWQDPGVVSLGGSQIFLIFLGGVGVLDSIFRVFPFPFLSVLGSGVRYLYSDVF